MTRNRFSSLLAVALAVAGPLATAEPEPLDPVFGDVVDVRVVNAEVVVTDGKGQRVPGLGRGDFRLLVDGRETPIDHFTEVREGAVVEAAPGEEAGAAPKPAGLATGDRVSTSYLVYIDDLFSLRVRRDEVLRGLKAELSRLGPEDRMAIVAYDGRQLVQLAPLSGSAAELAAAFDQALARRAHGVKRKAELSSMETSRRLSTIGMSGGGLDVEQLAYARQLNDRLERAVMAAVSSLRAFADAPGRKVMLLLAGGWPYSPATYAANRLLPVNDPRLPREGEVFAPLADTANRLGFTLYPVDVPGFDGGGLDASSAESTVGAWEAREEEVHSSLAFLATRTGGLAMINAGRKSALANAQADTRSYYWLGFTPTWRQDDRRHRIEVQVARPGLKVRSRQSVLDLSRQSEVTMRVESALLFGGKGSAVMPMALGKPERTAAKEMEVPVTLTIPLSSVTVLPVDGKYSTALTLRFAALDERGDRSEIPAIPLRWSFDAPPPADGSGTIRYDTRLKLRRIEQKVIAALFDPVSGKVTTAEAEVKP